MATWEEVDWEDVGSGSGVYTRGHGVAASVADVIWNPETDQKVQGDQPSSGLSSPLPVLTNPVIGPPEFSTRKNPYDHKEDQGVSKKDKSVSSSGRRRRWLGPKSRLGGCKPKGLPDPELLDRSFWTISGPASVPSKPSTPRRPLFQSPVISPTSGRSSFQSPLRFTPPTIPSPPRQPLSPVSPTSTPKAKATPPPASSSVHRINEDLFNEYTSIVTKSLDALIEHLFSVRVIKRPYTLCIDTGESDSQQLQKAFSDRIGQLIDIVWDARDEIRKDLASVDDPKSYFTNQGVEISRRSLVLQSVVGHLVIARTFDPFEDIGPLLPKSTIDMMIETSPINEAAVYQMQTILRSSIEFVTKTLCALVEMSPVSFE